MVIKNSEAIEHAKKEIELLQKIVTGYQAVNNLIDLKITFLPITETEKINDLLEGKKSTTERIEHYSKAFKQCESFLRANEVDLFAPTKEELKQFEKDYQDPYRWRWPAWIREPLKRFFTRIKKHSIK